MYDKLGARYWHGIGDEERVTAACARPVSSPKNLADAGAATRKEESRKVEDGKRAGSGEVIRAPLLPQFLLP